ncbi:LLM class flavin-dependent oxidoreductase [Streptomyces sp. NPDC002513]
MGSSPTRPTERRSSVLRVARHAEDLGFDHGAVGNRLLDSGFGLDTDPLVLLSVVAGATTHLRPQTSVLVAPYYPALVLANQAATLDVVSGGRLILGVGAGWNPDEFATRGRSPQRMPFSLSRRRLSAFVTSGATSGPTNHRYRGRARQADTRPPPGAGPYRGRPGHRPAWVVG